jgi:hypothetical protein
MFRSRPSECPSVTKTPLIVPYCKGLKIFDFWNQR